MFQTLFGLELVILRRWSWLRWKKGVVATQKSTLTSDLSLVVGRKTWRIQTNRGSRSERGGRTSGVNEGPKSSLRPRRTVITRAVKTCDPTPASPRTQSAAVNACYGWPGECANWPLCGAGAVRCPRPPLCAALPHPPATRTRRCFVAALRNCAQIGERRGGSGFLGNRTGVKNENGIPSWRDGGQIIVAKFRWWAYTRTLSYSGRKVPREIIVGFVLSHFVQHLWVLGLTPSFLTHEPRASNL